MVSKLVFYNFKLSTRLGFVASYARALPARQPAGATVLRVLHVVGGRGVHGTGGYGSNKVWSDFHKSKLVEQ
jgi:hypothetical protein